MKTILLGICLLTNVLTAGYTYRDKIAIKALLEREKAEKLNGKVIQFYVSHPKTAEYFYQGGACVAKILETYCLETEKLIEKYPQAQASYIAEKRVANVRHFLSHQDVLTKAGLFLFLGIYSLDDYKDVKSWNELLKTQEAIATHFINRARIKSDYKACQEAVARGESPLDDFEKELLTQIKTFCTRSSDPFFSGTLSSFIRECQTREDILKTFAPLRDETAPIPGEFITDAEEAFATLNEEMWSLLTLGVKEFFNRPETLERFLEITSDTFDIPYHPSQD